MVIRDPIWKNIDIPDDIAKIIQSREFQRLNDIKQLGPTYLVYPGATHTRFAHSIGVYHIASRLLQSLKSQSPISDFISDEGEKAFKIAALCHDMGHFPFTHALKELPLLDHEVLTGKIILDSPVAKIIENCGVKSEKVASIIDTTIKTNDEQVLFFRKLLSGVLDPDKLDYLNRDAFFCGVPYGIQDTDFTLSCLFPDKERGVTVNSKSIISIENLLFSKYLMYRSVYWHKDVRIATAMMKKSLFTALSLGEVKDTSLYNLTDSTLLSLINESKNADIWYSAKMIFQRNFYRVISEFSFNSENQSHKILENLEKRTQLENKIADTLFQEFKINQNQIIIDIPENISFESDIFINDENCTFSESSTVFTPETINSFTQSLRKIRVAVSADILQNASENEISKLKRIIADFF